MLRVVLTTVFPDEAEALAEALIVGHHAACVNILPEIRSIYRWQGRIHRDLERMLIIKVPTAQVDACMAAVAALHPYDVPEIIAVPVERVAEAYLAWAQTCVAEELVAEETASR